jgi:DNA-binding MarR family transcriptional regulator
MQNENHNTYPFEARRQFMRGLHGYSHPAEVIAAGVREIGDWCKILRDYKERDEEINRNRSSDQQDRIKLDSIRYQILNFLSIKAMTDMPKIQDGLGLDRIVVEKKTRALIEEGLIQSVFEHSRHATLKLTEKGLQQIAFKNSELESNNLFS